MNTPHWHELNNLHAGGQMALIVGKGPSLDAWLAQGCPRPDCAHAVIGVNHAGAAFPFTADYHVSGHKFAEFGQIPGTWVVGINPQDSRRDEHWDLPAYAAHWFLVTYGYRGRDYTREQIARTHRLFHQTSSAQLALHFAWYLGFEAVQFIGIDGGRAHAGSMQSVAGVTPPTADYDHLRRHTRDLADRLFPGRWWHWGTVKEEEKGELWKYQGIYGPQGYPGYGHSNHGAKALEWLRRLFDSVLDVGCGHNEFVTAWKARGGTGTGVDFACPGADVIAPATALPFADNAFQLVTAFDTPEHLPEHEVLPALREMLRVARLACCFSIATAPSRMLWQGQNLHPTVKPLDWWKARLIEAGGTIANGPPGYVFVTKPQ